MENQTVSQQDVPNILIVDDIPANQELLFAVLEKNQYRLRSAVSGELALKAVNEEPPDLILLDIIMPEMNGYEVCRRLKEDVNLKDIPVIFLSALNEPMDKAKAFGAGGVDYITKPFQFEEVQARVKTHLALYRQKRRLQENYDKLRELEKLRDGMTHMIVNDLRAPLTGIYGILQIVSENDKKTLSEDNVRDIAEAMKAAKQTIQLVSDVLDTNKMENGQMMLKPAQCDLNRILEECVSGMKPLFEGREIRFVPPESPVTVLADREILIRVIQNLLSNAIKFTLRDGGFIRLAIEPDGHRVRVRVDDNGQGVEPENRQKIFEKFGQEELRFSRQRYSSGMGLSFCKLMVEAHGGSIGVEGKKDAASGSSFWFELPVNGPVTRKPEACQPA